MKRVVSLMHRQAVRAKAEGLFFNVRPTNYLLPLVAATSALNSYAQVSTLNLFKMILDDQKSLPRDQAHKDLTNLVNFILRKFFKALAEDSFLAVEVHFVFEKVNLQNH